MSAEVIIDNLSVMTFPYLKQRKSVGCVLWHINPCRLFHAKSCLFIYIRYMICEQIKFSRAHLCAHS